MNKQPAALRLADALNCAYTVDTTQAAAAELRRLHALNAELLEALKLAHCLLSGANMNRAVVERKVRAAIDKAEAA